MVYQLSQQADFDLENIFDYSIEQFGFNQTQKYISEFDIVFKTLCNNPAKGRKRDEIRKGLRSINKDSHVIFYRVMKTKIHIVRILHHTRDLPQYF